MKKTLLALAVAALTQGYALSASAAAATVIDFESLSHADDGVASAGYVYVEDGFRLTNLSDFEFSTYGSDNLFYSGSTALINDNDGGFTLLTKVGRGAFSLYSIDLATIAPYYTEDGADITFLGVRLDNTTVTQTFHIADGATQTFSFTDFTNLATVSWTNTAMYHQFDNINVAAVPEPENYAMLLAGLGLMGFVARRRNAHQSAA